MTNLIETLKNVASTYVDNEKKNPLHVGEVMNLWTYMAMLNEANRFTEIGLNSTNDSELIEVLEHSFVDCSKQIQDINELFKKESITVPPTSDRKPRTDPNSIPLGVKMTDDEIANGISLKLITAIGFCAQGLSQSLRTDVGAMWTKFLNMRIQFNAYFNPIMRKRGWVKVPPYYYPIGAQSKPQ
ncbi:MAG: DUF3231 family protein [Bacillota bacterium]